MTLLLALLVLAPGDPAGEDAEPAKDPVLEPYGRLRAGVWAANGFAFEAVVGSVRREIDTHALFSAGVDGGVALHERFLFFLSYDVNLADHVFSDLVGASVGYREFSKDPNPLVPRDVTLYAGGIWGRFDVEEDDFGSFEDSYGFRAGVSLSWAPARGLKLSAIGEYRLIEFEYNEEVTEGDDRAGGSTLWIGLGLDLGF